MFKYRLTQYDDGDDGSHPYFPEGEWDTPADAFMEVDRLLCKHRNDNIRFYQPDRLEWYHPPTLIVEVIRQ